MKTLCVSQKTYNLFNIIKAKMLQEQPDFKATHDTVLYAAFITYLEDN